MDNFFLWNQFIADTVRTDSFSPHITFSFHFLDVSAKGIVRQVLDHEQYSLGVPPRDSG